MKETAMHLREEVALLRKEKKRAEQRARDFRDSLKAHIAVLAEALQAAEVVAALAAVAACEETP